MKKPPKSENYVNYGTDEQMKVHGYILSKIKNVITIIFMILTIGALRLIFFWRPDWMLKCTHRKCDLDTAVTVLLKVENSCLIIQTIK